MNLLPGDPIIWNRKIRDRTETQEVHTEVFYLLPDKKKIAVKVTDPSGHVAVRFIKEEEIQRKEMNYLELPDSCIEK